ncbi:MAG TPA: DedA family protein [Acidimicrobiales bacterium]|nr:DedA family protein [Acidimicrobiales bacterium]
MEQFLEHWGYLAIFVLTVLESACFPIPSEVTLGLGGALSSTAFRSGSSTHLDLGLVIAVGIAGSVVGSLIAYVVGRTGGRRLVDRYGKYVLLTHSDLDRVELWFARRGEWMVLYGRVIPVVRTFISVPAGMAKMRPLRFIALTAVGCAVWVSTLSIIGYQVGGHWQSVTRVFSDAGYIVAAIAAVGIGAFVWHRLRAVRRERGVEEQSSDASSVDVPTGSHSVIGGARVAPTSPANPAVPATTGRPPVRG